MSSMLYYITDRDTGSKTPGVFTVLSDKITGYSFHSLSSNENVVVLSGSTMWIPDWFPVLRCVFLPILLWLITEVSTNLILK